MVAVEAGEGEGSCTAHTCMCVRRCSELRKHQGGAAAGGRCGVGGAPHLGAPESASRVICIHTKGRRPSSAGRMSDQVAAHRGKERQRSAGETIVFCTTLWPSSQDEMH